MTESSAEGDNEDDDDDDDACLGDADEAGLGEDGIEEPDEVDEGKGDVAPEDTTEVTTTRRLRPHKPGFYFEGNLDDEDIPVFDVESEDSSKEENHKLSSSYSFMAQYHNGKSIIKYYVTQFDNQNSFDGESVIYFVPMPQIWSLNELDE